MDNEIRIRFDGGKKVTALLGGFEVRTDQPAAAGGDGSAPSPFALFLASIGACAGFYALAFCQARGIPTDGVILTQKMEAGEHGKLTKVAIEIALPPGFPDKYREPLVRAVESCAVKKAIAHPPMFDVRTV
ncbi:MAG: OsmC family protein [Deltaproteobacteria bacterium]|nr:OsmC family protein [Deltaproteobacteria bacterium]